MKPKAPGRSPDLANYVQRGAFDPRAGTLL
jgi:hypothetical protein